MRGAAKRRVTLHGHCRTRRMQASGCALACALAAMPATAADILAEKPSALSVTVYRAPERSSGSIDLDRLEGFALVSETRTVHLPAGVSRLRFEGVADGIEPASAIVTGLPDGVLEKNREGKLLSPSALIAAAVGKPLTLLRTDKKTGKLTRVPATIRSDAGGGVVFETSEGIEALRCSGLSETFSFSGLTDLAATLTLSVLVRAAQPVTRTVTLSYLARGFDWAADYTATLSADRKSMDLGAWVTLANGNGVGFPAAHAQVVAGRVNRESGEVEPLDPGGPILAECWPRGSTSDPPQFVQIGRASPFAADGAIVAMTQMTQMARMPAPMMAMAVTAQKRVEQEQLGDLKLYRVPDRTTVAARQSKQVRLLDRQAIPVNIVYGADLEVNQPTATVPASLLLRTQNTAANHLGLPLPSGRIAVFVTRGDEKLLQHESGIRDLAVDEEVEINMGDSPDVEVTSVKESSTVDPARARLLPLVPGVLTLRSVQVDDIDRVDVTNARPAEIRFELRLQLPQGGRVVRADHPMATKNGRPIFRLTVPANQTMTLRYQTEHVTG
jgi:hypothetical protein